MVGDTVIKGDSYKSIWVDKVVWQPNWSVISTLYVVGTCGVANVVESYGRVKWMFGGHWYSTPPVAHNIAVPFGQIVVSPTTSPIISITLTSTVS